MFDGTTYFINVSAFAYKCILKFNKPSNRYFFLSEHKTLKIKYLRYVKVFVTLKRIKNI